MHAHSFAPSWVKCAASSIALLPFIVAVGATCLDPHCWVLCPMTSPVFYCGINCLMTGRPARAPSEALIRSVCEIIEHRRQ